VRWLAGLAAAGLIAAGIVAVTAPTQAGRALDALVVWLGALAIVALAVRVARIRPPAPRSAIAVALGTRVATETRPPDLERLERRVELGIAHAIDLHGGLGPVLRSVAEPLGALRGRDVDLPERVRPGAPVPDDPHARGIAAADLDALLTELEGLAG
jgi:hypothetical protein